MLLVNDPGDWAHVPQWLEHSLWNGCTFADCIFAFFLFIVGVSLSLSLAQIPAKAPGRRAPLRKILRPGVRIVLLGLLLETTCWLLIADGHAYRPFGILQRTGICYAAAGFLVVVLPGARRHWLLIAALLLGYWLVLALSGPLQPDVNVADRIDSAVLGKHAYCYDAVRARGRDPEGLVSTLGALASVLLGVRAGEWLRQSRLALLTGFGIVSLLVAAAWSRVLPLNKPLWTSSFALWTAGVAFLILAVGHYLLDRRHWPALGESLGVNAIAAYAGSWLLVCLLAGSGLLGRLYQGLFVALLGPPLAPWIPSVTYAVAFTACWWLLMRAVAWRGWRWSI